MTALLQPNNPKNLDSFKHFNTHPYHYHTNPSTTHYTYPYHYNTYPYHHNTYPYHHYTLIFYYRHLHFSFPFSVILNYTILSNLIISSPLTLLLLFIIYLTQHSYFVTLPCFTLTAFISNPYITLFNYPYIIMFDLLFLIIHFLFLYNQPTIVHSKLILINLTSINLYTLIKSLIGGIYYP